MDANPHVLIEGVAHRVATRSARRTRSSTSAARSSTSSTGSSRRSRRRTPAGFLGTDVLGSGYSLDVRRPRRRRRLHLRRGDGAARLARGLPRPASAAPAVPRRRRPLRGPTVINNVETIASVPAIIARASSGSARFGHREVAGLHALLAVRSRHPARPVRGAARCHPARADRLAGGVRDGHELKFWTPGGSSTPILTAEHLDVPLDYEAVGAGRFDARHQALQIFDETTCVVRAVLRWTEFYAHESCGKCTPCREGTYWMVQILRPARAGRATPGTSTRCSTPATTSWAGRSARSATVRPARSRRRPVLQGRVRRPLGAGWLPVRPDGGHPLRRGPRLMTDCEQLPCEP